jgi:hypothetical protein
MYKKDKLFCALICFLTVGLSYWRQTPINETLITNLGTLFSILFGFYIAALSVLYGSAYSRRLYNKIDGEIPTQTVLHTLRNYFNASATWAIISLVLIVMTSVLADNTKERVLIPNLPVWSLKYFNLDLKALWNSAVLGVTSTNFYLSWRLLKVLLIGFLAEAKGKP